RGCGASSVHAGPGLRPAGGQDPDPFGEILDEMKRARRVERDVDLGADELRELAGRFKDACRERAKVAFPDDPWEQLERAIGAVFGSWDNARAKAYRARYGYPDSWGTAATVQAMVFGNMGDDCATGVAFTRDPSTGEPHLYGEFLANAQGEDVVAGIRTPRPIAELERDFPTAYKELLAV